MADDPFDCLLCPARFDLDPDEVERNFLLQMARIHPDLGTNDPEAATRAARLTDARNRLLNPESRASALLGRLGGPSGEQLNDLPDGFLMDIMEARLELEQAVESKDAEALARSRQWAERQRETFIQRVGDLLASAERSSDDGVLREIRTQLNAWRYIERMIEQARPT